MEEVARTQQTVPATTPPGAAAGIQICVLGDFTVTRDGESLIARSGVLASLVKAVAVLGPIDGPALAEIVWPGAAIKGQRARLLNTVGRLRREWGEIVVRDGRDVFRVGPAITVDYTELVRLAERAATERDPAESALRAVALYAGDLLPFDRYQAWTGAPRAVARARFLQMLDLLAELDERKGEMLKAVAWIEQAIAADPEAASRYVWAARLLVAGSRQGRASMMLRRAKAVVDELGVAPPAEYHRILAQASA